MYLSALAYAEKEPTFLLWSVPKWRYLCVLFCCVVLLLSPYLISNLMNKILIYLRIIHLLKFSTCFEHYPAHLQEVCVVNVYMQLLVSSLFAGDCLVHRLRKNQFFRNWCTGQSPAESDDTRGCMYTTTT